MKIAIYDITTGRIAAHPTLFGGIDPATQVEQGQAWLQVPLDTEKRIHWVQTMSDPPTRALRPEVAPYPGGPAPLVLDMGAVPEGSTVRATNNAGRAVETSDPADPIRLTTPGTFEVEVDPPFPWQRMTQTVEVTDA